MFNDKSNLLFLRTEKFTGFFFGEINKFSVFVLIMTQLKTRQRYTLLDYSEIEKGTHYLGPLLGKLHIIIFLYKTRSKYFFKVV